MPIAYLLVSHGSTDPRHRKALMRLAQAVRQHLIDPTWVGRQGQPLPTGAPPAAAMRPSEFDLSPVPTPLGAQTDLPSATSTAPERQHPMPLVGTATLEAATLSLADQMVMFAQRAMALGVKKLVVVPLFLLQGVHVMEDLPAELAAAQAQLPADFQVQMTQHLGGYQGLQAYIANRLAHTRAETSLLLAHGSRRPGSNRTLERTAHKLNAAVAFWAIAPGLEERVIDLIQAGHRHIAIAPYFLFAGGITDAITQQTEAIAERFPRVRLRLLPPLGSSADLARVVSDVALTQGTPSENRSDAAPRGMV